MKLDCVLTSCNLNPLYYNFIPIFVNTWKKLYPEINIVIVFIGNSIPEELIEYKQHIVLFPEISNIPTNFTSQIIRLFYPALLNYKEGILITDMDMLPMNSVYYSENIKKYSLDNFISYRNVLKSHNQIAICYNVASSYTWGNIFNIKTIEDVKNNIILAYSQNKSWFMDQLYLKKKVNDWNEKAKNYIELNDFITKFTRLDRKYDFKNNIISKEVEEKIKNHYYCDYHCLRPYHNYKEINDKIYSLL